MVDETKLREQVDVGETSRVVLKALEGAFSALEADCFKAFRFSDVHDSDGHMTCRLYLKVLEDVKARFTSAVINGEAAHKELVRIKQPRIVNGR